LGTLAFFLSAAVPAGAQPVRSMEAVRVNPAPRIDGKLDDDAWQWARWDGNFVQREPQEGQPATEPTWVAVTYDARNLYFGIRCRDSEPHKIIAREMRRDAHLDADDNFQIILDTYHDLRSGYYFVINPLGARRDATLANDGTVFNDSWDGIWECRTARDDSGWYAEIAIPWKTLRFPRRDTLDMGVNFVRVVRRKNEEDYWKLVPRDRGFFAAFRVSEAGVLRGIRGLRSGWSLDWKPYFLAGAQKDEASAASYKPVRRLGLDTRLSPVSNLTVDLTWNTDFAQVESDQEIVNLTRFSLFFPEKRDFFLEGAEMFSFGESPDMRRQMFGSPLQIFYSRRIGLKEGQAVPMLGGVRLTGKLGNYQLGALSVVTDRAELEDGTEPRTSYSALRLKRDIFALSSVGFMALNKQSLDDASYNRTVGLDLRLAPTEELTVNVAGAGTFSPDRYDDDGQFLPGSRQNYGFYTGLAYRSDLWNLRASYLDIAPHFNPEMGFVRRTDIRTSSASVRYQPRPADSRLVRQYLFGIEAENIENHVGILMDRNLELSFGARFQSGAFARLGVMRRREFLEEDWELRPGLVVPRGVYQGYQLDGFFRGDESRSFSPDFRWSFGDYYGGSSISLGTEGTLTSIRRVRLEFSYDHNRVTLPAGRFRTHTLGSRFVYYFSTNLFFKAYLQWKYDPLDEEGSQRAVANLLLRYTVRDGSDLYLVFNESVVRRNDRWQSRDRVLALKFVWFTRT